MNEKVEDAVQDALEAFWVVIAEKFPEVTSGDFDILETCRMHDDAKGWVESWLFWNRGEA